MNYLSSLSPEAYAAIGVCLFFVIAIVAMSKEVKRENDSRHGYTSRRKDRQERLGRRKP